MSEASPLRNETISKCRYQKLFIQTRTSYHRFCGETSRAISIREPADETYSTDYSDMPVFIKSRCRIEFLRFKIHGLGKVSIWNTPHYQFLKSQVGENNYLKYIETYYGPAEVQGSVNRFRALELHLSEFPQRNILLTRSEIPWSNWLLVVDGTHRAALAAFQGKTHVNIYLTSQ